MYEHSWNGWCYHFSALTFLYISQVNSLFPAQVRDRLLGQETTAATLGVSMPKNKLKSYLSNGAAGIVEGKDIPIADLFPFTTVLFAGELSIRTNSAIYVPFVCSQPNVYFSSLHCIYSLIDIAGFTAWSSVREPSQVFSLLETIYGSFDKIAQKRKVFKVSLARIVCSDASN